MLNSVESVSIEVSPEAAIVHLMKRYADRIALAVAIISILAIAMLH